MESFGEEIYLICLLFISKCLRAGFRIQPIHTHSIHQHLTCIGFWKSYVLSLLLSLSLHLLSVISFRKEFNLTFLLFLKK
jgi:hypothetical protein